MISIARRANKVQITRNLALLVAAIPLLMGYLIGVIVKIIKLGWAAFVIGYERGSHIGTNK